MSPNSFYQFQADRAIPDVEKQRKDLEQERDSIIIEEEDSVKNYYNLLQQYKSLKKELRDIVLSPKYVTSDDVVDLNGVFKDIKVEEMVSLLSCFVWQEKLKDATKPREELDLPFSQLQDTVRRVAEVQLECKVKK
ncbi:PREDICTED: DExH-box ATP-dependent RNA helicase [Prunus dulcis]|uniref:PREDICTED: DExH-box ATP-dependent RNA helicase n=1 Tax=Prunus dulcis TaxID=3755 RepID=A0A5E4FFJ6_PRUDU|nr:PREDICTED: DExH-box ATP-dependent RNA helicase [Prunus dulcis]